MTPPAAAHPRTPQRPSTATTPTKVAIAIAAEQRSVSKFIERQEKARLAKEGAERAAADLATGSKWKNTPTKPIEPTVSPFSAA